MNIYIKNSVDYCFPITEYPSAIQRALKLSNGSNVTPFENKYINTRTQDLEIAYFDAGQFYWGSAKSWLSNTRIHSNALGYVIPSWRVVDIDTEEDWMRAEMMAASLFQEK